MEHTAAHPPQSMRAAAAWSVAGPLAVGACLGLSHGAAALTVAPSLPAVAVGVPCIIAPALYIGAAFVGVAPPAAQVLAALARGLRGAGLVACGFAPVLLLVAATAGPNTALVLSATALMGSMALGLWVFAGRFFRPGQHLLGRAIVALWGLAALGIAAEFTVRCLRPLGVS
jgi:hypothetical protein